MVPFPGAELTATEWSPYFEDDGRGEPLGYLTLVTYSVPAGTRASEINAYYVDLLDGWDEVMSAGCDADCADGADAASVFVDGSAVVTMVFDSIDSGSYDVSIDHNGRSCDRDGVLRWCPDAGGSSS
jgi:hypothetical protein